MTVPCHTDTPALQRILSILSQQEGLTARQISGLAYVSERTLTCGGYLKTLRTAGPRRCRVVWPRFTPLAGSPISRARR